MRIVTNKDLSRAEIAEELRKAANQLSPPVVESKGSRRFPLTAGREIYEHFDAKFKDMIDGLKQDIEKILKV